MQVRTGRPYEDMTEQNLLLTDVRECYAVLNEGYEFIETFN